MTTTTVVLDSGEEIEIRGTVVTCYATTFHRLTDELILGIVKGELAVLYLFAKVGSEYVYLGDIRVQKSQLCPGAFTFGSCVAQPPAEEQSHPFVEEAARLSGLHSAESKMCSRLAMPN